MAHALQLSKDTSKEQRYQEILPQIESLIAEEDNLVANLANVAAVLFEAFGHFWTGFYLADGDSLVLGPFQGPLACTRIPLKPEAKGVCGASASRQETIIVPNVHEFPGHIACSSASNSEIVVPLVAQGETHLVLDVDSTEFDMFDETDRDYLEQLMQLIKTRHFN